MDKPEAMGGEEQKIAELVTESTCDTSLFGDEHLFYKHQLFEDDLALRPEWVPHVKKIEFTPDETDLLYDIIKGCPLAHLFGK